MITVRSASSISLMCLSSAVYAVRSASKVACPCGESTRMGLPPESITRGNRVGFDFTHAGV
jgi:hypothetical protein